MKMNNYIDWDNFHPFCVFFFHTKSYFMGFASDF